VTFPAAREALQNGQSVTLAQRFCNSARVISASISMSDCVGFAGLPTPSKIYLVRPVIFRRVEFGANLRAKKCAGLALFGAVLVEVRVDGWR
jgi:hypothetical protein